VTGHGGGARLWEVATGQELLHLQPPAGVALAFAPDGRMVATGERSGTILLWDVAGGVFGKPEAATRPGPKALEDLGKDLEGADAIKAYRAAGRLLAAQREAVPFLRGLLRPKPPDQGRQNEIARLIGDLDADAFATREKATVRLGELGSAAEPALWNALQGKPSLETRMRVERLLARGPGAGVAPLPPAQLRALTVLERLGTAEARAVLEALAESPAGGALAVEARAALGRLARRPGGP
jgi:hypothetical protein